MSEAASKPVFDDLIHPRQRLMLCAALALAGEMRFDLLAKAAGMSAPTLSKHLTRLADADYVVSRPDRRDSRRQWVRLTSAGRCAYEGHVAALRELTG